MITYRLRRQIQYLPVIALGVGGLMLIPGNENAGLDAATISKTIPARPSYLAGPPVAAETTDSSIAAIDTVDVVPAAANPPMVTASPPDPLPAESDVAETSVTDAPGFFTRAAVAAEPGDEAMDEESVAARLARATTAVNVRAGPSSSTAKLFVLQAGESVRAISHNGGWIEVETAGGESGWVYSRYLEAGGGVDVAATADVEEEPDRAVEVASAEPEEPQQVDGRTARAGGDMALHAGPSGGSPQLFVLERGERVTIAETRGNWARVILRSGASGWVRLR